MAKFVLLYTGGNPDVVPTETESAATLKAWDEWYKALGEAIVDEGNPFTPRAKRVESDGDVKDEPRKGMATGYTVIKAADLDQAVALAKGCPILKAGGAVTVYETFAVG